MMAVIAVVANHHEQNQLPRRKPMLQEPAHGPDASRMFCSRPQVR